jgi:hypothetical protein
MDLLLQLQQDVCDKLNSESVFATVPFALYAKWVLQMEVSKKFPDLMGKVSGGKTYTGVGGLVMMPEDRGFLPNIAPPQSRAILTIWIVECPEINMATGSGQYGTGIQCEQWARTVRRVLHQMGIEGLTSLYQQELAIAPLIGLEKLYPGRRGYAVNLIGRMSDTSVAKCAEPQITDDGEGNITLTVTDGSAIYYTVDGTFPGSGNSAGTATLYSAPFHVAPGAVVRWASYKAACYGSDACQATITD